MRRASNPEEKRRIIERLKQVCKEQPKQTMDEEEIERQRDHCTRMSEVFRRSGIIASRTWNRQFTI